MCKTRTDILACFSPKNKDSRVFTVTRRLLEQHSGRLHGGGGGQDCGGGPVTPHFAYKALSKDTSHIFRIIYYFICKFLTIPYYLLLNMQIPHYSVLFTALHANSSLSVLCSALYANPCRLGPLSGDQPSGLPYDPPTLAS